ncbi:MAG: aminotransferase class [Frankiales bacterium]|jgi:pyridoxal 5-phosphate dependent beta-lyase|nr:aminotransferase class [Frankiales bacterium]
MVVENVVENVVQSWVRNRLTSPRLHLDTAACGRVSTAVLEAQVAHLQAEAAEGGYVAEADNPLVEVGRQALGGMVGLGTDDVAFLESGGAAFAVLLAAWPLPAGARIGIVPSEYGGNAAVLARLAAERGWSLVRLPVDPQGRITAVPRDLDLVTFPQVPSQRGVAQPVQDVLRAGVPVVLDVAQALGQTPVPAGCAAYVGTSRKWLCGPRGVGFAVVDPSWQLRLASPPTLAPTVYDGVRRFESPEANVAGRAGLAVAAREWSPALLGQVQGLATQARALLAELAGWQVVEPVDEPTGITTLRPTGAADPMEIRAKLLADGIVTSVVPPSRAADMDGPVLRVSTAAWVTTADLERLVSSIGSST